MAGWLKQALTKEDNKTYDGAYLALAAIICLVVFVVANLLVMAWIDMFSDYENSFNYAGLGGGIAAIIGALAGFLAGVGSYILMDRKGQAATDAIPASTTTTESQSTVVKTVAPVVPVATPVPAQAATDVGAEPLSPTIAQKDVGSTVTLVKPRKKKKTRRG